MQRAYLSCCRSNVCTRASGDRAGYFAKLFLPKEIALCVRDIVNKLKGAAQKFSSYDSASIFPVEQSANKLWNFTNFKIFHSIFEILVQGVIAIFSFFSGAGGEDVVGKVYFREENCDRRCRIPSKIPSSEVNSVHFAALFRNSIRSFSSEKSGPLSFS